MKQVKRSHTWTMLSKKHCESTLLLQCMACLILIKSQNVSNYYTLCSTNRMCTKTITLSNGATIPKGTQVFLPFYSLHHDPKYWKEPEKFDPDRWVLTAMDMINTLILWYQFLKVHSRRESEAAGCGSHAIWLWTPQLYWDEVCSTGS